MMLLALIASVAVHSVVTNGVEVRWFEEMVPMRDGTRLYTYGALPPPGVKCATVFERSPYVKEMPVDGASLAFGDRDALARGYVRVRQHVRGCGMSEGEHVVYVDERADGLASLEWIRTLPHYNGEIYLSGASYCASVHWSYLNAAPADVKGAVLTVQDVNRYNIHYRNGNYKAALHGNWVVKEHRKKNRSLKRDPSVKFTDLPLKGFSLRRLGDYVADLEEVWDHPRPEDRWWSSAGVAGGEYRRALQDSKIPVLLVTGFYDIYTEGLFDMWRELSAERRANCALVVDTGDHPTRDKGEDGALDWFDWCRGKGSLRLAKPGMTVWHGVWGDRWKSASEMDDAPGRLVLHLADDARLSSVESAFHPVSFAYDPKDPPRFNSIGCLTFGGMKEQPETGWRTDVVSFVSEPFGKEVEVRGRMRLRLRVSSDCEDTAFYVRLSARKSDGKWYNLRDDIKTILWDRADYRPGEDVEIVYRLSDHAFTLAKGDLIRLEIAGASAEQFIPHVNLKGPFSVQRQARVAQNAVKGGVLMLPVDPSARRVERKGVSK